MLVRLLRLLWLLWDEWLLLWLLLGHRLGNRWRVLWIAIGRGSCRRLCHRNSLVRKTQSREGAKRKRKKLTVLRREGMFSQESLLYFSMGNSGGMEDERIWKLT